MNLETLGLIDFLIVNESEYEISLGSPVGGSPADQIGKYRAKLPCDLVVSLGPNGAILAQHESTHHIPGHSVSVVDTTGAGDCLVGAFAARLASGESAVDSLRFANRAAALSITRRGASVAFPTLAEVQSTGDK